MSNQTINDLRTALFDTIAKVKDGSLDIEKAKTVSDLAQVIINSAKVEVEHTKITGQISDSGFLSQAPRAPALPPPSGHSGTDGASTLAGNQQTVEPIRGGRLVTHRIK